MRRPLIPELMQVPPEQHDLDWLKNMLQWAVDLEFATIPTYLSGMWSIKDQGGEVFNLINSVVLEEMLHMGLACNMLTAVGGKPQIVAPSYPGPLPGGVRPGLNVYLAGLSTTTAAMYMQIELPEHPLAQAVETFPTIGAFYDTISAAFTALSPSISTAGQISVENPGINVPDPNQPELPNPPMIDEPLGVLASIADVQAAIATIKDQGEGTAHTPDAPQFDNGELAHYYRFGEIFHGKLLIPVDGGWDFTGDPVPMPDCWPVATVPKGGYPGVASVAAFDEQFGELVGQLENVWSGGGGINELNNAIGTMEGLYSLAATVVATPLPGGGGNYGPDFIPPASG